MLRIKTSCQPAVVDRSTLACLIRKENLQTAPPRLKLRPTLHKLQAATQLVRSAGTSK